MLSAPRLIPRYGLFAALAMLANFISQALVLRLVGPSHGISISLLGGTLAGFFVKYALDKRFIFFDGFHSARHETMKLGLYGVTAILTTLVFWSLELGAWILWHTSFAKYVGGAIGLCIGYLTKYVLDRRYVFSGAT
jgi:putative flippase GtrA